MSLKLHAMFFSTDADATRAFLKDKLQLPFTDVGEGWLIFDMPKGDLGCHPAEKAGHDISFHCDDLEAKMAELKERGVELGEVRDDGWGLVTNMTVPGVGPVTLYQPKYTG